MPVDQCCAHPPVRPGTAHQLLQHHSAVTCPIATDCHKSRPACSAKLSKTELFKVLRPFHTDDAKLQVGAGVALVRVRVLWM